MLPRVLTLGPLVALAVMAVGAATAPAQSYHRGDARPVYRPAQVHRADIHDDRRDEPSAGEHSTLPRGAVVVRVGSATYYRDGRQYYQPVQRAGRTVYVATAPPVGAVVTALPSGSSRIVIRGVTYHRDGQTYFAPVRNGRSGEFVVVAPPAGASAASLPAGYTTQRIGSQTYYYAGGVHYRAADRGYQMVEVPLGWESSSLPAGATAVRVQGRPYYKSGDVYYEARVSNGRTVYVASRYLR
ncbi:DUF6515 family protein [Alienimonas californiensis]|uniref:Uncharacterized protein n=1 Tax=Alienimonas californiensis TaxID=2527989 RepID=A0A517P7S8_9PLAN|nr:DUF6515 family protein [Alienimonas californiensis]QDT15434.1 hypothetical protein CA12_15190 [Alienimonas californiensis]